MIKIAEYGREKFFFFVGVLEKAEKSHFKPRVETVTFFYLNNIL